MLLVGGDTGSPGSGGAAPYLRRGSSADLASDLSRLPKLRK
jgi:hypothetical protein